jgi:hypothetical protein
MNITINIINKQIKIDYKIIILTIKFYTMFKLNYNHFIIKLDYMLIQQ